MPPRTHSGTVRLTIGRTPAVAGSPQNNPDGFFTDVYLYLMTCGWPLLLAQVAAVFLIANSLFALGYLLDGGIEGAHSFADDYFFSVETMATVGYGKMAPVSLVAHLLMTAEVMSGLLGLAVVTGLIFAKFSRPTARVRFSRYAVVANRDGLPSLMFRMANERSNQIVEAEMHVVFSRMERTVEGEETRRFYDLDMIRRRNAIFAFSWTAVHPIVPGSPLYGSSAEALEKSAAWIVVSVTGIDETLSQTVHARMYYAGEAIQWGARLSDVMMRLPDGSFALDYTRFDDVEPAELKPWDESARQAIAAP